MNMEEIFKLKNIAVYGMSTNPMKAAYDVPVFLLRQGYNIIPINPTTDDIAGKKAYAKLIDIPDEIDILNVFRPSEQALGVVEEAVERKKAKGDIKLIWLQEGIINDEAKKLAEANGMEFIQDMCMFKELIKL